MVTKVKPRVFSLKLRRSQPDNFRTTKESQQEEPQLLLMLKRKLRRIFSATTASGVFLQITSLIGGWPNPNSTDKSLRWDEIQLYPTRISPSFTFVSLYLPTWTVPFEWELNGSYPAIMQRGATCPSSLGFSARSVSLTYTDIEVLWSRDDELS